MAQPIPASSENYLLLPFSPDMFEKYILQRRPTTIYSRGQSLYLINVALHTFQVVIELTNNWTEVFIIFGNLYMISIFAC
jgi:hypothetical protein